ncbi:hypothetical protein [Chryseobacterium joostei]|uniref:hypothetical protein n=1 Tax=Chryseobacterium joostei TaxID=112234 RepID=UPI003D0D4295
MRDYTEFKYQKHFFESERLLNNLIIKIFPEFTWKYYRFKNEMLCTDEFFDITNSEFVEINEEDYETEKLPKYKTLNYELQDECIKSKDFLLTVNSYMEYLFVEFIHDIVKAYKEIEIGNRDYFFKNVLKAIESSTDYYKTLLSNKSVNDLQLVIIKNLLMEQQRKSEYIKSEFFDLIPYVDHYFSKLLLSTSFNHKTTTEQYQDIDLFVSEEAKNWFMDTLEWMGISPGKSGFNAKLNAIYSNKNCKETIFRYELSLKDYIDYINFVFPNSIKNNTKMSDPSRHESKVDQLIKIYLQNKPE